MIVSSGAKQLDPVGVMACDEESFKVFAELFDPIVKDLHPDFNLKNAYNFEELNLVGIENKIRTIEL
jgi:hypothetical protein